MESNRYSFPLQTARKLTAYIDRVALTWAAANGRVASIARLLELGADIDCLGTFGGPDHGQGVTAMHLAAQSGQAKAVEALLAAGAIRG